MFDTHCHLTFRDFDGRVDQVLASARRAGVHGCITVATGSENCREALSLARAHADVWCTAGVHPLYSDRPVEWSVVRATAADPRCVAWGELGLDNHYDRPDAAVQRRVLEAHLGLIEASRDQGLDKPIVVHCRKAVDDLLAVFRATRFDPARFVFHCFTEPPGQARKVLDFGAWISFTGVVTFRNAPEVAASARLVPDERIMVETDAPFLSPEPVRTMRPNEPANVAHVARHLATLRGVEPADLERRLDDNARRFFGVTIAG
jgi:TatD DNase family protein